MGEARKKRIALLRALPRQVEFRDYVPLFAPVLCTAWRRLGHEVLFCDRAVLDESTLWTNLCDFRPDVVALSATLDSFVDLQRLAKQIRIRLPDAAIVAGGPHITELGDDAKKLLDPDVQVFAGDGCGYDPALGAGIEIDYPRPLLPDWTGIDVLDYHPVIPVQTTIGCINHCAYCSESTLFGDLRSIGVDEVVRYIADCVRTLKVYRFRFVDSTFSAPPSRFDAFCHGLMALKLPIQWGAYVRWEQMSKERIDLAVAAGCRSVFMGVESLNPAMTSVLRRSSNAGALRALVQHARSVGIEVHCSLIFGLPHDTIDGVRLTAERILEVEPTTLSVNPFKLGPGSEYGRHPEAHGITIYDPNWKLKQHLYQSDREYYDDFRVDGFSKDDVFTLIAEFTERIQLRSAASGGGPMRLPLTSDWSLFEVNNKRSFDGPSSSAELTSDVDLCAVEL
ncbi:MAG TPA: cobalamin-dependent protein, partial [Polyangium sp.]|nr:cobalamin-dependent protein [Polyangium sp.]